MKILIESRGDEHEVFGLHHNGVGLAADRKHLGYIKRWCGEWIFHSNRLPNYLTIKTQAAILKKCRDLSRLEKRDFSRAEHK